MRNLKKILALALALVMSMSLMATANAFSDDEDITGTYKTAVDVLSGLKVFQGYDDGSFQPKGPITRAEVAAIIYRIVTGDVNDTQKDIYADYNKFDDVKSTSWYAGYVNFCANAEYIKGYDATHFGPNDPVTGYQALAMILRALGYDKNGEFTGTNWTIQTAAVGESQGITKNITAGTLNTPATREVVAEILFQAIMVPKATYTPAFGYQTVVNGKENTSLGWDTFELENVVGVVTANEYADLYDTEAMAEGKTRLDVDGEDYTIDYATDLTNIGMAYDVYLYEGGTVLTIADAGNTVFETGEGTAVNKSNTGMKLDEDVTEYFVNFDNGMQDSAEVAEYFEIEYVKTGTQNEAAPVYKTVKYRVGAELDKDDLAVLKTSVATLIRIEDEGSSFNYKDSDVVELNDVHYYACEFRYGRNYEEDEINYDSWKGFSNKYLTNDNKIATADVTASDNGEWLKVIDNDNDGVADVVLLTEFVMSAIDRISSSGTYYLSNLEERVDAAAFDDEEIDEDDIKTEDELAVGDVVIYTLIDGNYYVDLAEIATETVDKKGINSKTETMTCDGVDYIQSHIGYTTETYYHDVTDAHTEVTYDLYLDHFGYVRLFIESDYDTFMLLTDGWYEDDRRVETFQAMYWNVEAGEEERIDVVDNDGNFFYDDTILGDEETWGNLKGADVTYLSADPANWPDTYATNIAGYAETADGYDLRNVESSAERIDYEVQGIEVDKNTDLDDREFTGFYHNTRDLVYNTRIQTGTSTQYYLVTRSADGDTANGWNVDDVITWTGYANAPDEAVLADRADVVAYAVTRASRTENSDYYVADVVVFETLAADDYSTYFVYEDNNWHTEHVWVIGYDENGEIESELQVDVERQFWNITRDIDFYEIDEDGNVRAIDSADPDVKGEYAAKNIYAGEANTSWDLEPEDYIQVRGTAAGTLYVQTAPIYYIVLDTDGDYNVYELARDDVANGHDMIVFTDSGNNVKYAIDVTLSYRETAAGNDFSAGKAWDTLYNAIVLDATVVLDATTQPTVSVGAVEDTDNNLVIDLTYAQFETYANANDEVPVTIVPAAGNSINIEGSKDWSNGALTTNVKIDATTGTGKVIVASKGTETDGTGNVKYYTVTVNVTEADGKKDLTSTKTDVVSVEDGITNVDGIIYLKKTNMSVSDFMQLFETNSMAADPIAWTFTNAAGSSDDAGFDFDYSQTLTNITDIKAVVTAEDGTTATYELGYKVDVTGGTIGGKTSVYVVKGDDVHVDLTGPSEYTVNNGAKVTVADYTEGFDVTNITEDTTIAVTELASIAVTVVDGRDKQPGDIWDFYFGTTGTTVTNAGVPSGENWYGVTLTMAHDTWGDDDPRTFTFKVEGATCTSFDVETENGGSVTGSATSGAKKVSHNFVLDNVVGPVTITIIDVK